jgi:hypothetical protein
MSTTATIEPPRAPRYAPNSWGGRYTNKQYTDPGVTLNPGRTTFSGYDLRKYREAGQGSVGRAWTATVFRENQEAVVLTDNGDGEGVHLTGMGSNMNRSAQEVAAFRFLASEMYGTGADATVRFSATLKLSADIDRHARANGITRPEAVWDQVQSGAIDADEAPLFINGYFED